MMNDPVENQDTEEFIYSEHGFLGRSIVFSLITSCLILWLTDASAEKAWLVAGTAGFILLGISMIQATVIENGIILIMVISLVWFASITTQFGFHWSILIAAMLGAINGITGRDSAARERFRRQYGAEEYEKRYKNQE
jgi:hypothetical protein